MALKGRTKGFFHLARPWLLSVISLVSAEAAAGNFASFRYDDDFRDARGKPDLYSSLKHVDLGDSRRYLSVGGDLRERVEYFSKSNVTGRAVKDEVLALHRVLVHADLHFDDARAFIQIGAHDESGREPQAKPTDVDGPDIQQAFVDYSMGLGEDTLLFRAGRQEMAYGASRLVTTRDGPNIRLSFDGVRAIYRSTQWNISLFAMRPVEIKRGAFDDRANREQSLSGIYGTREVAGLPGFSVDLYHFRTENEDAGYTAVSGREKRRTFGSRLYGKTGAFDGDIELMLQEGTVSDKRIRAFALAADAGWTFAALPWRPRVGLKADVISGDRNSGDGKLGTFNALYPNGSYFSEAGFVAQANLIDLSLSVALKPGNNVSVAMSLNPMWRYSVQDAVYRLPLIPMPETQASGSRYIGTQAQFLLNWQYSPHVSFKFVLVRFEAGTVVEQSGGRDSNYAQFATAVRF